MIPSARTLKVRAGWSRGKGRAVFAVAEIAAGELIDEACTVALDGPACAAIETTPLADHYFRHPGDEEGGLIVLGLPSLCNHAEDSNAATETVRDARLGWVVRLTARRDIAPGEEITRAYACPIWFTTTEK